MHEATPPQSEVSEHWNPKLTNTESTTEPNRRRRRLSPEQQLEIAQMYAEAGASVGDIRRQFGVSEPSVYRVLDKHGVSLRGRQAQKSNARTALDSGESRAQPTDR